MEVFARRNQVHEYVTEVLNYINLSVTIIAYYRAILYAVGTPRYNRQGFSFYDL